MLAIATQRHNTPRHLEATGQSDPGPNLKYGTGFLRGELLAMTLSHQCLPTIAIALFDESSPASHNDHSQTP
jgi:hypothetical protein